MAARAAALGLSLIGFSLLVTGATWLAARRRAERVVVSGPSMEPALEHGDHLLVWRLRSLRAGHVVAAHNPERPDELIVKRIALVAPAGAVLLGDNVDHSTDSRHFGPVPLDLVVGRVIYRYAPAAKAGRVRRRTLP